MNRKLRRLRVRLTHWWDRRRAPWPIVGECYGHRSAPLGTIPACSQCIGDHQHVWVAWIKAPGWVTSGPGIPVRCRRCGARKCDAPLCDRRRHDHTHGSAVLDHTPAQVRTPPAGGEG